MTNEILTSCGVDPKTALRFGPAYDAGFQAEGISDPLEIAHFLTQVLHETGNLRFLTELWGPTVDQKKYERDFGKPWTRKDQRTAFNLGNTFAGDGRKYSGRGGFNHTGRYNYSRLGFVLHIDLINDPELLMLPQYSVLADLDYWKRLDIGRIARGDDRGTTTKFGKKYVLEYPVNTALLYVTAKINPGLRGIYARQKTLTKIKKVMGLPA